MKTEIVHVNGVLMVLQSVGESKNFHMSKLKEKSEEINKTLEPHFKEVVTFINDEVVFTDIEREGGVE